MAEEESFICSSEVGLGSTGGSWGAAVSMVACDTIYDSFFCGGDLVCFLGMNLFVMDGGKYCCLYNMLIENLKGVGET